MKVPGLKENSLTFMRQRLQCGWINRNYFSGARQLLPQVAQKKDERFKLVEATRVSTQGSSIMTSECDLGPA